MNRTLKIFFILFLWIPLCESCQNPPTLTEEDLQLSEEAGFDAEIIQKIRSYTDSIFYISAGNPDMPILFKDSSNYIEFVNKDLKGLVFSSTAEHSENIVTRLREDLYQKGYLIYRSGMNFGYMPDKVTILKTTDKYDLLRFEATNGINYDLYPEDIIIQLMEWDILYGLKFTAVGFDFIEADIKRLPKDISAFCTDLYAFCPDIVEQGTGTIEALKAEVVKTSKLFLWWD